MKERLVKDFLSLHLQKGAKLLLGLSGGPDSMALLHFLLASLPQLDFSLHLAHVDHGWREESSQEARALQALAAKLKLPFHLHTLNAKQGPDLENRCRLMRLAFFKELHEKYQFQALLLAHHGGDQAETVLKRVFEGGGLKAMGGLHSIAFWEGLTIWRPLLALQKRDLVAYLDRKHIPYFIDPTDHDLRSKMRKEIVPDLERQFGKNIQRNCIRLGALCQELSTYFEEKSCAIEKKLIRGPFGDCLPLEFHPLEIKYFIKRYAEGAHLSRDALDLLIRLIKGKRSGSEVHASPLTFSISRSHLFILKAPFPDFFSEKRNWTRIGRGNWENFWQGEIAIPEGTVQIESFASLEPRLKKKMREKYATRDVPPFFYEKAPIFMKEGRIVGECLTGESLSIS